LSEEQKIKTRLIRSSMKRMMVQLGTQKFVRCHQSYLINKDHMQGLIRKKNQTYVELAYLDFNVNVSRGNLKNVKALLAS
jgi:DNA-binding LytR/AlgR family response regulator